MALSVHKISPCYKIILCINEDYRFIATGKLNKGVPYFDCYSHVLIKF